MDQRHYSQKLHDIIAQHGLQHYGWTSLNRPLSMDLYRQWIEENQHLDMNYLEKHLTPKEIPPPPTLARSAIVLSVSYLPHPWPTETFEHNPIALYAKGKDYHREIPRALEPLLVDLRTQFPGERFEVFTDSAPILERDLAYRAGLGWIGKNTCLIDRQKGSLFLLAEIYTTLPLRNENPWSPNFCGHCNQCVEACPTQALTDDRRLLPSRCISYWTIEAKTLPPENLRSPIGEWLFGCDICQTVCPWNQKHLKLNLDAPSSSISSREERIDELKWILESSRKTLARHFHETPLARAAGWKLQRNAIIVATQQQYHELSPLIEKFKGDHHLDELARWSLKKMGL